MGCQTRCLYSRAIAEPKRDFQSPARGAKIAPSVQITGPPISKLIAFEVDLISAHCGACNHRISNLSGVVGLRALPPASRDRGTVKMLATTSLRVWTR